MMPTAIEGSWRRSNPRATSRARAGSPSRSAGWVLVVAALGLACPASTPAPRAHAEPTNPGEPAKLELPRLELRADAPTPGAPAPWSYRYLGDPWWHDDFDASGFFDHQCHLGASEGAQRRVKFTGEDAEVPVYEGDASQDSFAETPRATPIKLRKGQVVAGEELRDVTVLAARVYRVTRSCTVPCQDELPYDGPVSSPFHGCKTAELRAGVPLYTRICGAEGMCDALHGDVRMTVRDDYLEGKLRPESLHACARDNVEADPRLAAATPPQWWIPVHDEKGPGWVRADDRFILETRCADDEAWERYPRRPGL